MEAVLLQIPGQSPPLCQRKARLERTPQHSWTPSILQTLVLQLQRPSGRPQQGSPGSPGLRHCPSHQARQRLQAAPIPAHGLPRNERPSRENWSTSRVRRPCWVWNLQGNIHPPRLVWWSRACTPLHHQAWLKWALLGTVSWGQTILHQHHWSIPRLPWTTSLQLLWIQAALQRQNSEHPLERDGLGVRVHAAARFLDMHQCPPSPAT